MRSSGRKYETGPDKLNHKLHNLLGTFLAEPLADLFNSSLVTAVVPGDWKATVIFPKWKKGDPEYVANYRPVSLISVVCKVIKRILKRAILSFLTQCKQLTGCQHGVLPHRSCLFNLLILEEIITRLMGDGNTADVVYLDFARAFDSVYLVFI